MRAVVIAVLVALALAGCTSAEPVPSVAPTVEPTETPAPPRAVEPDETLGSWLFVSGTVDGTVDDESVDELGNFVITVTEDGVRGGSVCGSFSSTRTDGAIYPLDIAWEPGVIGDDSLCHSGPRSIFASFGSLSPRSLENDTLELADATTSLFFARTETPDPIVTNWLLDAARDASGSLTVTGAPDLRLDPRDHFLLFTGCSRGSGMWAGGSGGIRFDEATVTGNECSTSRERKLDTRYRAALEKVTTARIQNGKLVLTGGKVTLKFLPAAG